MDENLTEQQQIELLKKIWKEYGVSVIAGVALALILGFGWRFYQSYKIEHAQRASVIYESTMIDLMNNQTDSVAKQAHYLIKEYKSTPFAKLAGLVLAQQAVKKNDFNKAIEHLTWVLKHASNKSIKQISRIRLARIYNFQNKSNQALSELKTVDDDAYQGLILDVKGDAYKQLNQLSKARESYVKALTLLPANAVNRPILEMKLHDLPV